MVMVVVDFVFYEKLQNGKKSIGKVKSAPTFTFSLQKLYVNRWYVFAPLRIHWGRHGVMEKVPKGLETLNDQLGCKKSKSGVSFSFFLFFSQFSGLKKKKNQYKRKKGTRGRWEVQGWLIRGLRVINDGPRFKGLRVIEGVGIIIDGSGISHEGSRSLMGG